MSSAELSRSKLATVIVCKIKLNYLSLTGITSQKKQIKINKMLVASSGSNLLTKFPSGETHLLALIKLNVNCHR